MLYEVFIPSVEADGFDESITVDAENWMAALKSGLERTGEGSDIMRNLMCDIKDDNSIHVTDAVSRRVFVLRELEDDAESAADGGEEVETVMTPAVNADAAEAKAAEEAKRAAEAKAAEDAKRAAEAKAAEDAKRAAEAKAAEEAKRASEQKAAEEARLAAEAKAAEVAKRVAEAKAAEEAKRAAEAKAAEEAKRAAEAKAAEEAKLAAEAKAAKEAKLAAEQKAAEEQADKHIYEAEDKRIRIGSATHSALKKSDQPAARIVSESRTKSDVNRTVDFGRADEKVSESLIEDIFLEIQDIHEGDKSMQEVIDFVMDMAMEKIGAESGSVLFADVNGQELYFAAARGPKAADIMDFRVPMGMGIVGFCTREGVSLAISDAENDPRFYKEISESLGYDTHGLLCAPIQHEGRVYGAIEVMNKKASGGFSADETNALAYIGRQLAQYVHGEIMRNEKIS